MIAASEDRTMAARARVSPSSIARAIRDSVGAPSVRAAPGGPSRRLEALDADALADEGCRSPLPSRPILSPLGWSRSPLPPRQRQGGAGLPREDFLAPG